MSKSIIHKLLSHGAQSGATALVIETSKTGLAFNYKFEGGGEQNFFLPGRLGPRLLDSLRQILKIARDDLKPAKNFKLKEKNYQLNFKLNIVPVKDGEKIIIQILKKNGAARRLKQLGYQKENLQALQNLKKFRSGLIIISSPENNGKTATLNALLKEFDLEAINAYWLEKNPEQLLPGINYLTLSAGSWNKILSHDSNLIILDDLKSDQDLIRAIEAAGTGRLVIAALEAASSLEIILRILKLDLPLSLKINNLRAIINQRLTDLARPKKTKAKSPLVESRVKIAVSEIINFNQKLKKYLIAEGANYQKEIFWKKLGRLIAEDGFRPTSDDLRKKISGGTVKKIG